jgi:hypothetical protein
MPRNLFIAFATLLMSAVVFGQTVSFSPPVIQVGGNTTFTITQPPGTTLNLGTVIFPFSIGGASLITSASCTVLALFLDVDEFEISLGLPSPATTCTVTLGLNPTSPGVLTILNAALIVLSPGQQDGPYQISYAANLNIGDSEINISNDGSNGGFYNNNTTGLGAGNICVNAYVFDPSEEEIACCSCLITPNALVSLSAKNSLIADVLTPAIPTSIVIKLTTTVPGTATGGIHTVCDPTVPFGVGALPGGGGLTSGALAWGTTLEPAATQGTYGPVNVPFINGSVNLTEVTELASVCSFVQQEGTGFGVCNGCALGALGGTKQ